MAWDHELYILVDAIRAAGAEVLQFSSKEFVTHTKEDLSPVTSADLAVNQILESRLLDKFPHDAWLSEESPDNPARLQNARVWVIDPIDGTKAFISREPEFCISAALVEEGRPVVATILNPTTNELFTAIRGGGLLLNHQPVSPRNRRNDLRPVIALIPWEQQVGRFKSLDTHATSRPIHSIAWALALAASGRIHAVATFEPENEWDVAAGALLLEEAGGTISDGRGLALEFNRPEPRYRGIIAMNQSCPYPFAQRLRSLPHIEI